MTNPWLEISESDYLRHMGHSAVDQLAPLNRLFGDAMRTVQPRRLLMLGATTGNGLEHIDATITRQVTVVDINPQYLARLRERFPNPVFELDVRCADLEDVTFEPAAYDLVHAALVLEYVDWRALLPRVATALAPHAVCSAVLQLPSSSVAAVTPTGVASIQSLAPLFQFVDADSFIAAAATGGLRLDARRTEVLTTGKMFEVLYLAKSSVESS